MVTKLAELLKEGREIVEGKKSTSQEMVLYSPKSTDRSLGDLAPSLAR